MTIVLLVEGRTETALKGVLKRFLDERATAEGRPKVALRTKDIMTLNRGRLSRRVQMELRDHRVSAVVGLIDVYPDFELADKARVFLREVAGDNPRFHAHTAQYDVEAWLLPYWDTICRRLGVHRGPQPE